MSTQGAVTHAFGNEAKTLQELDANTPEAQANALIVQVGKRVFAMRKAKRLSRRELSESSGVSPRYLARLEGGEGNVSIALLQRIAIALDQPIESFFVNSDSHNDEDARLLQRYRNADTATREQVLQLLDPLQWREQKAQRICLIGLRGAGKSTLGSGIAKMMNLPFIELNNEIERNAGIPIAEVIAMYGEAGYRTLEAETLQSIIARHDRLVLAVAGGAVEQETTFSELLTRFHTIWLKAAPEEHMQRVRAQGDLRPMAGNPRAMEQLREILIARESRYAQSEHHLDTSGKAIETSLSELHQLVSSQIMLEESNA